MHVSRGKRVRTTLWTHRSLCRRVPSAHPDGGPHVPSSDHFRHAPRRLGRPLPRRRRGLLDPGGRRQRHRCRLRRGHRARRVATGPGECRRRGADHDPSRRRNGRKHRRPRLVAEAAAGGSVHARARRKNPRRRAAHRGPRRARRLDHRVAPARHHAFRRGRRSAIRFAAEGFSVYPLLATSIASHEHEYRRWQSNTAIFLPGGRVPKPGTNSCRPTWRERCSSWRIRTAPPAPDRLAGLASRARCLLPRRHRARDRALPATGRRLPGDGRSGRIPFRDRTGGAAELARARADHLRPVVPGAGVAAGAGAGRAASASTGWRTTRPTTCTASSSA